MDFDVDFSHLPDYVLCRITGHVSVRGFERVIESLVSDSRWVPGIPQIFDNRGMLMQHITHDEMLGYEAVIRDRSERLGDGACAYVVSHAYQLDTALAFLRKLHETDRPRPYAAFYSPEEADAWIREAG